MISLRFIKTFTCFFVAISYLSVAGSTFAGNMDSDSSSPQKTQTVEKFGVSFQLQKCKKIEKKASCQIKITSYKFDKRLALTTSQQRLIDNIGNEYSGVNLQIGDQESSSWLNFPLKSDLPTNAVIHFQNLSAKADRIDVFEVVGSLSKHGKSNYVKVRFNDIPFSH